MQQDTTLLDRLAGRAGIAISYHSIDGTLQVVGDDSKRALLAAMGFDAGSDAAIAAALAELDAENERPLPPVLIAAEARGITVPLNLPSGHSTSPIDWTLETEEGDTISGRATPGENGQTALQLRFEPALPCGYHQLALDLPDGLTSTRLIVAPPRAFGLADLGCGDRVWGVAAPLYGLRSSRSWGIGDFADLDVLVESAAEAGAALVGINPVHALFPSQPARISPYSPSSRLFLNPLHVALDAVPVEGAAESGPAGTLAALAAAELVDYTSAAALKFTRLDALYARFNTASGAEPEIKASFDAFVRAHSVSLYRHALFEALSEHFNGPWQAWPAAYRSPDTPEVDTFAEQNVERIDRACFAQWLTEYQLAAVQDLALQRGMPIGLYGDLAVGVDPEGADAWAMPEVHARGVSLGAPPDKFSPAGQEWGLAPLLPGALRETGYDLFIAVLQGAMRHVGALRIDHALGLERCFWVPADGAAAGSYVHYPVDDLLAIIRLESHRNRCVVIGEDLGNVPRMLRTALTESGLLGYRVFDFERDHDGSFRPAPAYPPASLASATTHDLPTSRGYWQGRDIDWRVRVGHLATEEAAAGARAERTEAKRAILRRLAEEGLLPDGIDPQDPPEEMPAPVLEAIHRFLAGTPAAIAIVQFEDMVGETEQANLPGTIDEHPNWRRRPGPPLDALASAPDWHRLATVMAETRGVALSCLSNGEAKNANEDGRNNTD